MEARLETNRYLGWLYFVLNYCFSFVVFSPRWRFSIQRFTIPVYACLCTWTKPLQRLQLFWVGGLLVKIALPERTPSWCKRVPNVYRRDLGPTILSTLQQQLILLSTLDIFVAIEHKWDSSAISTHSPETTVSFCMQRWAIVAASVCVLAQRNSNPVLLPFFKTFWIVICGTFWVGYLNGECLLLNPQVVGKRCSCTWVINYTCSRDQYEMPNSCSIKDYF